MTPTGHWIDEIDEPKKLRDLPFRGELSELAFVGNGKHSELRATLPDGSAIAIALSDALTTIRPGAGVVVSTVALGDISITVRYRPEPGHRMRVTRFELNYPGTEREWRKDSARWLKASTTGWWEEGGWAVPGVYVDLVAWSADAEPPAGLEATGHA